MSTWKPIDLDAAYELGLPDVLDAVNTGQVHLSDGVAWFGNDDVTEEINDLCGRGLLYNDAGRLVVLTPGLTWLAEMTR